MDKIPANVLWTPRPEAEASPDLMQVIPCATVRDPPGRYHTFLRVQNARSDLSNRVSLVIGGHVEPGAGGGEDLEMLAAMTLAREIREELEAGLPDSTARAALATDPEEPDGARHMAGLRESMAPWSRTILDRHILAA